MCQAAACMFLSEFVGKHSSMAFAMLHFISVCGLYEQRTYNIKLIYIMCCVVYMQLCWFPQWPTTIWNASLKDFAPNYTQKHLPSSSYTYETEQRATGWNESHFPLLRWMAMAKEWTRCLFCGIKMTWLWWWWWWWRHWRLAHTMAAWARNWVSFLYFDRNPIQNWLSADKLLVLFNSMAQRHRWDLGSMLDKQRAYVARMAYARVGNIDRCQPHYWLLSQQLILFLYAGLLSIVRPTYGLLGSWANSDFWKIGLWTDVRPKEMWLCVG